MRPAIADAIYLRCLFTTQRVRNDFPLRFCPYVLLFVFISCRYHKSSRK